MSAPIDWLKLVQGANGGPLPVVNDSLLGQYGAQQQGPGERHFTAQDTGWSFTPNSLPGSVDYTGGGLPGMPPYAGGGTGGPSVFDAPPGWQPSGGPPGGTFGQAGGPATNAAGRFGYTYTDPGAGFDPWGLYDGGTGYSGRGDGLGLYDPHKDTAKGWGPNGQTELDRDRVWRMTLDAAKAEKLDPGAQDPQTRARVRQIFLDEIARLHRDYRDTQGLGEAAWASSPFAAYDKYLAGGGQAGQTPQQAAASAAQAGAAAAAAAGAKAGQQGGSTVNPPLPPMGQGAAAGAQAAGATTQPGGNPITSDPQGALGGGTGGIDQLYQNNQAYRTAQLLKALGLGDINSRLSYGGSVVAQQAPGLFEAWREAQGAGGKGLPNDMGQLGAFANIYNSPGALGNIAQTGQQGLNWAMGQGGQGLKDTELIPLIQAFEQLANLRQSDTMQRYYGNLTDQGLGQFLTQLGPNNLTSRLAPYLQSNPLFGFLTGHR